MPFYAHVVGCTTYGSCDLLQGIPTRTVGAANQSTDNIQDLANSFNNAGGANNGLGITAVISSTGGGNNNTITLTSAAGSAGQLAAVNSTGTSIYTTDSATTSMQASQSASRQKFNHAIECVRDVRDAWKQVAQEVNQGEPQTSLASANRPQLVQTTSDPDFDSAEVGHWTA